MQFFSFPLLTPTYIKLKKKETVTFKPLSLPGCLSGGFGLVLEEELKAFVLVDYRWWLSDRSPTLYAVVSAIETS